MAMIIDHSDGVDDDAKKLRDNPTEYYREVQDAEREEIKQQLGWVGKILP